MAVTKLHTKADGRQVRYVIQEASNEADRSTVILYFYPLSGSALIVNHLALPEGTKASLLCVDRPDVGPTSTLPPCKLDIDPHIYRIQEHANDVLEVLDLLSVDRVYLLPVCLGHPYAIQVARRLSQTNIQVMGLTLVAPFVSPACPDSWWLAQLGNSVPSWLVTTVVGLSGLLLPAVLNPSALKQILEPDELVLWSDEDLERMVQVAMAILRETSHSRPREATLGTSKAWQYEILDAFARENGLFETENSSTTPPFPIVLHASLDDQLARVASVEWVAQRCYGKTNVTLESNIHSHATMTFLGGPPRNPVLLHEILRAWGLY